MKVPEQEPDHVWVLDTSAIIQLRRMYDPRADDSHHRRSADDGYFERVLQHLSRLLITGQVTYPGQVDDEAHKRSSPDSIAEWTHRHKSQRVHGDPSFITLRILLGRITSEFGMDRPLADPFKTGEDADPWVVVQALDLQDAGYSVAVVTEEYRRRRHTTSIPEACQFLGIACVSTLTFLRDSGAPPETSQSWSG